MKILGIELPELDVSHSEILIVRAGTNGQRDIDDDRSVKLEVVYRGRRPNASVYITQAQSNKLERTLKLLGWAINPGISVGRLWSARPPAKSILMQAA